MLVGMVIDGAEVPEDAADPVDHAAEALTAIASGEQDAFARLYDMLAPRVLALIVRVLVDRAQSEEVLQEVFLEIWQTADRFAPKKGQGRTWIFTIAHRRAIDRVRSAQSSADRDARAGLRELAVPEPGTDELVETRIEAEKVAAALSRLPDAQREALTLAYYGGYTQSEIAALTASPLGTVKTRMRDGLSRMRTEMGVAR